MNNIYLDASATTPPHIDVINKLKDIQIECWGNPSSGINPPTNITISGNDISYVLGSAISLGTNTDSVSISGNSFSNIIPVIFSTTYLAICIQAELSNVLDINNNTYDN